MRIAWGNLAIGLVLVAGAAEAQTWQAVTALVDSSPTSCPKAAFGFDFTLQGERLTVTNPAGKKFEGSGAPDGTVKVEYQGASQVGKVTISGNARTQQLELTGSALTGCRYALKTGAAAAQQTYQWSAAVDLVQGAYRNCGDPPFKGRTIVIRGPVFTATPDTEDKWNDTTRLNLTSLKPDGSGRITVNNARTGAKWHFDFDAGQGARTIIVSGDNVECRYRWKPV